MSRPLDGITVIALEHAVAAPFCTRQLAELGARVIKIERPGSGDFARGYDDRVRGLSSHFVWCNRSKESLALDLKHPQSRAILQQLLARADVLVQNLAPGAAARLGLSHAELQPLHPRLIVCNISGYGDDGPYRDRKAYDLLIQAESGFLSVTGTPEQPVKAGCSIADIAAAMYAYSNILAALLQRGRSGKGCVIDVSMLESMVEWMGYPLYYAFDGAAPPARAGAEHSTITPYGPYPAGDGRVLIVGLQNEREWQTFCRDILAEPALADDARFATNPQRSAHRETLRQIIVTAFARDSAAAIAQRLDAAQIANAVINDMHDVWQHPQLRARAKWTEVATPAGAIPALLPPRRSDAFEPRMAAVPAVGEHTQRILAELGLSDREVAELKECGAI